MEPQGELEMPTPNIEQKMAIEHRGGVLLSAGAGSGKTFVLVEHIIYLIEQFNIKNKKLADLEYEKKLRSYCSRIVLMTFTKKAAGELELRLKRRIEQQQQQSNESRWNIIDGVITSMTIGTIHGFCHKLLSAGFFSGFDPNVKIINSVEAGNRIEILFRKWFDAFSEKTENRQMLDIIVSNWNQIVASFTSIFDDSGLRTMWKKMEISSSNDSVAEYFEKYFEMAGLDNISLRQFDISCYQEHAEKKWYIFLKSLNDLLRDVVIKDKESFEKYVAFFESTKGVRAPTAKSGLNEVIAWFGEFRKFKKVIMDNKDDFLAWFEHKNGIFNEWPIVLKDIFNFIDRYYMEIPGVTFSDLEYFVLTGMEDNKICQRIRDEYHYFVIDEFQDTSIVQFAIIKSLIGDNYQKLFCVGDIKQAIYGFRGGEIGVFKECMKMTKNLSMKNNYRSRPMIINYNNELFGNLFKSGREFSGTDKFAIQTELQEIPAQKGFSGQLVRMKVILDIDDVDDKKKTLTSTELDRAEARIICDRIIEIKKKFPTDVICILYRKLSPSRFLISMLMEENIDFSAQVKVSLGLDPVVGIFKIVLDAYLEYKAQKKYSRYVEVMIGCYFEYLNIPDQKNIQQSIKHFFSDLDIYGVYVSYCKFLFSSGISNSNHENNLSMIKSVCQIGGDSPDCIWNILKDNVGENYSFDFQTGPDAGKLLIMSAHSSKGLEFDHVILGGIHTNGRKNINSSYFGKMPGSFKWKLFSKQKKPFKSPEYLMEEMILDQKEFSESKRLFYVACTRAVESLSWCDIVRDGKPSSYGRESWINGIRSWESDGIDSSLKEHISKYSLDRNLNKDTGRINSDSIANVPPLFHRDPVGVVPVRSDSDVNANLGVMSELSVTRLAVLAECPMKFYLQNICRLDDELEILDQLFTDKEKVKDRPDDSVSDLGTISISSSERGTMIHEMISQIISGHTVDFKNEQDENAVEWICSILKEYKKSHEFVSESPFKFPLFGHMITGIPDLILKSSESVLVWDFKTGRASDKKEKSYWFQLLIYGYACYQLGYLERTDEIEFILAWVDQHELSSKKIGYRELCQKLYEEWCKIGHLESRSMDFCHDCRFDMICKQQYSSRVNHNIAQISGE